MTMQIIPLTQLIPSPLNVRKTGAKDGVPALAASIAVHGLLQNLQVRPAPVGELFEVVAGGRRLAALQLLAKQKQIAPDYAVPCDRRDDADATEISLAENELRLPMHPADQFDAFKKLADGGKGLEEIAARFGTTAKVVQQRLKLAVVSPKLVALYRKGGIGLDCLMAFTIIDNHKQQEKIWKELPDWARQDASRIREVLTNTHIAADSSIGRFVGIPAYEAAGGAVLRDLFDEASAGWLTDAALVNRLAAAKLEESAAAVRTEGWKWVEIMPVLSWEMLNACDRARPEYGEPTETQQREIETLTAEGNALTDAHGEEPEDEAAYDRLLAIQDRIADLSEGPELWPDAVKAMAGVIVTIGQKGDIDIRRGFIRPEDKAVVRKAERAARNHKSGAKADEAPAFSAALIEDLSAHRTAGLQAKLAANPKIALVAVTHALALGVLYRAADDETVLGIGVSIPALERSAGDIETSKARKELAAATTAMRKGLPKDPAKLWGWLLDQDHKTVMALLALCAAHSIDAVQTKQAPAMSGHAEQLAGALKLDMAAYWQPTAAGYFSRVSKQQALDAVAEGTTRQAADNLVRLKKGELAKEAEKLLTGSGWLPALLRAA